MLNAVAADCDTVGSLKHSNIWKQLNKLNKPWKHGQSFIMEKK